MNTTDEAERKLAYANKRLADPEIEEGDVKLMRGVRDDVLRKYPHLDRSPAPDDRSTPAFDPFASQFKG